MLKHRDHGASHRRCLWRSFPWIWSWSYRTSLWPRNVAAFTGSG